MSSEHQGPMCHSYGIRGYGNPDDGVVVVGIAPGRDEALNTHKPFTGASGRLLNDVLKGVGWRREQVYTTNVLCWWNNKPSPEEIEQCGPRFRHELLELSPKLIITAGAIANETVMGAKRRKGSRGSVVWNDYWKAYILDTHHPSFALQSQSMSAVQDIIRDLSKIPAVLDWPRDGSVAKIVYSVAEGLGTAQQVLNALPRGRTVTLDIETSNTDVEDIDPYNDRLLCFALSYLSDGGVERNVVFPGRLFPECVRSGQHGLAVVREGVCPQCKRESVLDWPLDVQWTFQFGQFDIPALYNYFGVRLPLKDDTGLMSACTDERPGYHGLKANAREWLGAGWYEDPVKPYYKGKMHLLKDEVVEEYNAKDAAYDRRLVPIFMRKMYEDDTYRTYKDVLVPAINTFIDMQIRGIKVNQARLRELAYENWFDRYLETYRSLQLEAHDIGWPTDDINFNSSPQLRRLFFQIIGVDPIKFSKKTGAPSLDKETLDRMDHPFAAKIRAFRTLDTMIDYVLAIFAHLKHDGRLHPSAFVTTTRTGRTSYRNPAMQTIPKDYTVGADYARIREIFEPHNTDTHEILEADYNQIEVWLAWHFSKDPVLLEHLMSGDVHSATAEGAFNTKRDQWTREEWDAKRQNAKKIRFGIQYGEGAEKLASPPPVGIGGTINNARRFIENYKRTYPVYTAWMDAIQRQALEQGYLRAPDGGVMRFPVVMDHKQLRQALNFPIQRTASMYNLTAMAELYPQLLRLNSHIILNIHDALVVESDRRYRAEVAALVRQVMEKPRFPGCPSIKVDMKVGDNLGEVRKFS